MKHEVMQPSFQEDTRGFGFSCFSVSTFDGRCNIQYVPVFIATELATKSQPSRQLLVWTERSHTEVSDKALRSQHIGHTDRQAGNRAGFRFSGSSVLCCFSHYSQ